LCVCNNVQFQLNVFDSLAETPAHGAARRTGARGNQTFWPHQTEDFVAAEQLANDVKLPRWGNELMHYVNAVIYRLIPEEASAEEVEIEHERLRKQIAVVGRVRLTVVVELIETLVNLGQRFYKDMDLVAVRSRVRSLPDLGGTFEDGTVPKFLIAHFNEKPQGPDVDKSATPANAVVSESKDYFVMQSPHCVMDGGDRHANVDHNACDLEKVTRMRVFEQDNEVTEVHVEQPVDAGEDHQKPETMFRADFWLKVYPFLFPLGIAAPDYEQPRTGSCEQPRDQRTGPKVEFRTTWSAAMARRVETQFRTDQGFCFAAWNFVFRTVVNIKAELRGLQRRVPHSVTDEEILEATDSIYDNLFATYRTSSGRVMPINGDLIKLRQCGSLTPLAKQMLMGVEATLRKVEGSQHDHAVPSASLQRILWCVDLHHHYAE